MRWTGKSDPAESLHPGDLPAVRILELGKDETARFTLERLRYASRPEVSAFVGSETL